MNEMRENIQIFEIRNKGKVKTDTTYMQKIIQNTMKYYMLHRRNR